jgi:hypothetical protein
VIAKDDPQPREINVISGKMFLFLCDQPYGRPYLSAFIFTSFVVLTGFMLISLTVAAVSGGVHLRLEQIQKQQYEEDEEEEDLTFDEQEEDEEIGTVTDGVTVTATGHGAESDKKDPIKRILQMESFQESSDEAEDDSDGIEPGKGRSANKEEPEADNAVREFVRDISSSKSSDIDDAIMIRPVSEASARLTLARLQQDDEDPIPSRRQPPPPSPQAPPSLGRSIKNSPTATNGRKTVIGRKTIRGSPGQTSPALSTKSSPTSTGTPNGRKTFIGRKTIRGASGQAAPKEVKEDLPLLQDKELIRMILKQMWSDVDKQKEKKREEEAGGGGGGSSGDGSEEKQVSGTQGPSPTASSFIKGVSFRESRKPIFIQSTVVPSNNRPKSQSQLTRAVSVSNTEAESLTSPKHIAYLLKNILSTYYYIGYIILIILGTAIVEILCTNNNNCGDFWGFFVGVQILLSIDILVRVFTHFPSYQTFFLSRQNLFDMGMVLIIWIPIFYTGEGTQIAGECVSIISILFLCLHPLLFSVSLCLCLSFQQRVRASST